MKKNKFLRNLFVFILFVGIASGVGMMANRHFNFMTTDCEMHFEDGEAITIDGNEFRFNHPMMGSKTKYGFETRTMRGGIYMWLFVLAAVGGIFYFSKKNQNSPALDRLNQRLINGEISIEEFEKIKDTLLNK